MSQSAVPKRLFCEQVYGSWTIEFEGHKPESVKTFGKELGLHVTIVECQITQRPVYCPDYANPPWEVLEFDSDRRYIKVRRSRFDT